MVSDFIDPLTGLGLSCNQAKIYLAVALSNAETVKAISRISNVPIENVYRSMSGLEDLNLIVRTLTKPVKFRAMPLKEAITMLERRDKKERYELYKKATSLARNVVNDVQKIEQPNDETVLITSFYAWEQQLGKFVENAKELFQGITFPQCFRLGMFYNLKQYECSVKRGIDFQHLVHSSEEDHYRLGDEKLSNNPLWERKFTSPSSINYVLIDNGTLFMPLTKPCEIGKRFRGVVTTSSGLVALAKNYYDALWRTIS